MKRIMLAAVAATALSFPHWPSTPNKPKGSLEVHRHSNRTYRAGQKNVAAEPELESGREDSAISR